MDELEALKQKHDETQAAYRQALSGFQKVSWFAAYDSLDLDSWDDAIGFEAERTRAQQAIERHTQEVTEAEAALTAAKAAYDAARSAYQTALRARPPTLEDFPE